MWRGREGDNFMRKQLLAIMLMFGLAGCDHMSERLLEKLHWTIDAPRDQVFEAMVKPIRANGKTPATNAGTYVLYQEVMPKEKLESGPEGDPALAEKYQGGKLELTLEYSREITTRLSSQDGQSYMKVSVMLSDDPTGTKTIVTSKFENEHSGLPLETEKKVRNMLLIVPMAAIGEAESKFGHS
jgi:hypothetical protein